MIKFKAGTKLRVTLENNEVLEGIVMPKTKQSGEDTLVIKLPNGYNIGLDVNRIKNFEVLGEVKSFEYISREIEFTKDPNKQNISILGAGGTIASRIEYLTGAVISKFSPDDLIISFPELRELANVDGRKIFDLMSEDATAYHWQVLAEEVYREIKNNADGVIITHGTDTMHYTSAALSFALQNLSIPVILVGAQRSSDRGSSDNYLNLLSATFSIVNTDIAEVCICMHGSMSDTFCFLHQGTRVRKMHTSRRDTFQSINALPFAKIFFEERKIEFLRNDYRRKDKNRKVELINKFNPNVGLIYIHPNIKPEFISSLSKFYEGIVLAVTGLGHVPTNLNNNPFTKPIISEIKNLIDSNIPVVIAPQTLYGRLNLNVYAPGRILNEIGVIGNYCDWLPEVAYVKLSWVLGQTKNMEKVKKLMLINISGELSYGQVTENGTGFPADGVAR